MIFTICVMFQLAYALESLVIVSEFTPTLLRTTLQAAIQQDSELSSAFYSPGLLTSSSHLDVIFDYTFSTIYAYDLRLFATSNQVILFSSAARYPSNEWVFYLHPLIEKEAAAFHSLVSLLDWGPVHLTSSNTIESLELAAAVTSLQHSRFQVADFADSGLFDGYVGRVVKPSGNWRLISTHSGEGACKLSNSIRAVRINRERGALLVPSKAVWGCLEPGTVGLVEQGLELAQSEGHYEYLAVKRALAVVKEVAGLFKYPTERTILKTELLSVLGGRVISEAYSVINYDDSGTPVIIGSGVDGIVTLHGSVVYFGGATTLNVSPPVIRVSADLSTFNLDGTMASDGFVASLGLNAMTYLINLDPSFLNNFVFELQATECGMVGLTFELAKACFPQYYNDFGLVYLTPGFDELVSTQLATFEEDGIEVPVIRMYSESTGFYDKSLYPKMAIITPDVYYISILTPSIIKIIGWQKILLLIDSGLSDSVVEPFLVSCENLNIEVLNKDGPYRVIYGATYEEFFLKNKDLLLHLAEYNARIFVTTFFLPVDLYVMQALYDLGFRNGEFVFVLKLRLSDSLHYADSYGVNAEQILQIGDGSLTIEFSEYVGEYGEQLKQQVSDIIAPYSTSWTCYSIETLMLSIHAIDMMLQIGRDYEDPDLLMKFIRMQYYTGCTGTVSIDSETNGRTFVTYHIINFFLAEGGWESKPVATYTMGVTIPFKVLDSIIWPGGSTEVPSDMKDVDFPCGFDENLAQTNQSSVLVSRLAVGITLTIAAVVSVWAYYKTEQELPEELTEKVPMMFEDAVVLMFPVVETLQFLGLGPSVEKLNWYLAVVCSAAVLDFEHIRLVQNWWYAHYICCTIAGLCVLSAFLYPFYRVLPQLLRDLVDVVCFRQQHICWHIGVLTVVIVLTRMLRCDESSTGAFHDSFSDQDCKFTCWSMTHISLSVTSLILVGSYLPLGLKFRLSSEASLNYYNVKSTPLYVLCLSIFKMIVLLLSFSMKTSPLFPLVYTLLFVIWSAVLVRLRPFNYARLNMWQRLLNIGLVLHGAILSVSELAGPSIFVLQALVVVIIALVGLILQFKRYPSCLLRKKGQDIGILFRFMLGNKVKVSDLKEHSLDIVDNARECK